MVNSSKEAVQVKEIPLDPKAKEGITNTINLVMAAIRHHYPAVQSANINGVATEELMVRSVGQVHTVPVGGLSELERVLKSADDILLYTLLKNSGIPEDQLMPLIHRTAAGAPFYFHPYGSPPPQLYFHEGDFDDFLSEDTEDQLAKALDLGGVLIATNLNLAPTPREIPEELRGRFKGYIVAQKEELIAGLESKNKQEADLHTTKIAGMQTVRNIDITRNLMDELILKEEEGYHPRLVAFGGRILFIMPHQDLIAAELTTGDVLHRGICQYLAMPILDMFFHLLIESFNRQDLNRKNVYGKFLSPNFLEAARRVRPFLDSFAIGRPRSAFDAFRNSEIALNYAQKVDNKKGKFDPGKYPA